MRPLTSSFSRDELSLALEVSPEVIDALIQSGSVLCHVRDGEPRIPLDQLEAFFRDGLLRLYRLAASEGRIDEPVREPQATTQTPPLPPFAAEEPEAAAVVASPVIPIAAPVEKSSPSKPDSRLAPRYLPRRHIDGIFNDVKFTIVQLSTTGLRVKSKESMIPGAEAKLSFALMNPPQSFVMRAKVVWTSIATHHKGGETFSISGLRITEHTERLSRAIEILRATHDLQPERRDLPRTVSGESAPAGTSDEEIALVMGAVQKFGGDPLEASRWYARARFAVSDENVRAAAPQRPRDREEVLGIWEYLERQVEIPKITAIVAWIRKTRVLTA
ncbi:MAG TPA: PilZ domain-containing protein [Thermoanaerobaculia bacterium]|jgi:Tfp pilus assembly protein PilZ